MMQIAKIIPCFIVMLCTVSLAGCSLFDPTAPPALDSITYTFGFTTLDKFELSDVELYMDRQGERILIDQEGSIGARSTGDTSDTWRGWGKKGHLATAPSRIPDRVIVTWSSDLIEHEQEISLARIVPDRDHYDGTIWFIYETGKWRVAAITTDETRWRVTHGKGEVPVD